MKVVCANLPENSKSYFFDATRYNLEIGTNIIVEVNNNNYLVEVNRIIATNSNSKEDIYQIVRVANKKDMINNNKNKKDAKNAFSTCKKLISKYKLDMNLISSYYTFDRKQLIFQFTSDARVDFRDLAKEIASIFRTRIELRQIGVRDKAKSVGGLGVCGMQLCCKRFLNDIDSVSINMAKNQGIALNPSKINGVCGRLLCCLKYEDSDYSKAKKSMPKIGDVIDTEYGKGKVVSTLVCQRKCMVDVPDNGIVEIIIDEK